MRFDLQRDFGDCGQFFDLLLRVFKVFGVDFSLPFGFVFRCFLFDDGICDGLFRRLNWSLFDLFGARSVCRGADSVCSGTGKAECPSFIVRDLFNGGGPVFGFGFGFAVRRSGGR